MFSAAKPSARAWLLPEQEMRSEGSTLRKVERRGGTGLCLVEQQGIFAKIRAVWPSNFREKSIREIWVTFTAYVRQIPREQVYPLPAFIITARKSVDSRLQFYPWELFWAVFISSFSILRTSQLVWRFPFAVNVTLNLSIIKNSDPWRFPWAIRVAEQIEVKNFCTLQES